MAVVAAFVAGGMPYMGHPNNADELLMRLDGAGHGGASSTPSPAEATAVFCEVAAGFLTLVRRADLPRIVVRLLEVYPPCREVFADLVLGLPAGDLPEFAGN